MNSKNITQSWMYQHNTFQAFSESVLEMMSEGKLPRILAAHPKTWTNICASAPPAQMLAPELVGNKVALRLAVYGHQMKLFVNPCLNEGVLEIVE